MRNWMRNQRGQGLVEYGLILGVATALALAVLLYR